MLGLKASVWTIPDMYGTMVHYLYLSVTGIKLYVMNHLKIYRYRMNYSKYYLEKQYVQTPVLI